MNEPDSNCLADKEQPAFLFSSEKLPFVSVLVPCRNEERYIARCLDSLLANDYPKHHLEMLVIDGMSEDQTRVIVAEYTRHHPSIRLVDNPGRTFPAAINAGIRSACGDVILITSAHSLSDTNYVSACLLYQQKYGADNVGGILQIIPGAGTRLARAIAVALGSIFGSGNAYVKTGVKRPVWADTAAFGCYRRKLFDEIGLFDERLVGSSDMDFNRRILEVGGKILLVPEIVVQYFADATLGAFWRHNFADGVWASYVLKFGRRAFSWRHWMPLVFVVSLFGSLALSFTSQGFFWVFLVIAGLYSATSLAVSAGIALRERQGAYMVLLPCVFSVRHFAHALGALFGLLLVILPGVHWKGRRTARG